MWFPIVECAGGWGSSLVQADRRPDAKVQRPLATQATGPFSHGCTTDLSSPGAVSSHKESWSFAENVDGVCSFWEETSRVTRKRKKTKKKAKLCLLTKHSWGGWRGFIAFFVVV